MLDICCIFSEIASISNSLPSLLVDLVFYAKSVVIDHNSQCWLYGIRKHVSHSTKHMLQKKYERQENIIYLLDNCRSSRVIIWLYEHVLGSLSFFVASSSSWSSPTTTSWLSWPPIRWSSAICHGFPSGNTCCCCCVIPCQLFASCLESLLQMTLC